MSLLSTRLKATAAIIVLVSIVFSLLLIPPVKAESLAASPTDDYPWIDTLVAYTPLAKQELGGQHGIETLIQLAVSETNVAYKNSQITQRLRLVHMVELSYPESAATDLFSAFANDGDGAMDEIHQLRNDYGADLVSLIINDSEASNIQCGVANKTNPLSQRSAFSIVRASCAVNFWTFAHETGHNLGLCHGWDTTCSYALYARGYGDTEGKFYTIMEATCVDCQKIPYFSNPNVTYNGRPTGIANSADAARALNETGLLAANWRPSIFVHQIFLPLVRSSLSRLSVVTSITDAPISNVSLTALDAHRFVTATRDASSSFKVTVWSFTPEGAIARLGAYSGTDVSSIAVTALNNDHIIVASGKISDGKHYVYGLRVDQSGTLTPSGTPGVTPAITPSRVEVTRLSNNRFVTVVRRDDTGKQLVTVWDSTGAGVITRQGNVSGETADRISVTTMGQAQVATAVRDIGTGNTLSIRMWDISSAGALDRHPALQHSTIENAVAIASLGEERLVTASRDGNNILKLMVFDNVGAVKLFQQGISYEYGFGNIAIAAHSSDRLITATRNREGRLQVSIWGIAADGALRQQSVGINEQIDLDSDISVRWVGDTKFVTTTRNSAGQLQITLWSVE